MGVFAFIFTAKQATETKGRSPERIEADLRNKSFVP